MMAKMGTNYFFESLKYRKMEEPPKKMTFLQRVWKLLSIDIPLPMGC